MNSTAWSRIVNVFGVISTLPSSSEEEHSSSANSLMDYISPEPFMGETVLDYF